MMEEKIIEIIKWNMGHNIWGEAAINPEDIARHITAHVFEFIEWMSHNTRVSWSGYIFLHGASFPPKWNTVEEIYEYWITNIKTQEK